MGQFEITTVTSILVATTMLTLVVGYVRALTLEHGTVFHLAASISLVFFSYAAQTLYWDVFSAKGEYITDAHALLIFNLIAIWGGLHGHIAIYKMIPDEERHEWSLFTAWAYPPLMVSRRFRRFMRWLFSFRS